MRNPNVWHKGQFYKTLVKELSEKLANNIYIYFCKLESSSSVHKRGPFARFAEILQNCAVHHVFGRMCLIVFLAFPLKLHIQTLRLIHTAMATATETQYFFPFMNGFCAKQIEVFTW